MFRKEFSIKSNVSLKSSEKKKFIALLRDRYNIVDDHLRLKNEEVHLMNLTTFNDHSCDIYVVNKTPWLIKFNEKLYPTVYFLWKYPECALYSYVMNPSVVSKIQSGADLMLPGLIIDGEITERALGKLEKGTPCSICLPNNRAAVAVGCTNISSLDMLECGLRGKGVQIVHILGDYLWKMGPKENLPQIPLLSDTLIEVPIDSLSLSNASSEGQNGEKDKPPDQVDINLPSAQTTDEFDQNVEDSSHSITEIFTAYFLMALKDNLKAASDLPVLASTFYGSSLLSSIRNAEDQDRITIQKTEFKKFSAFLQHMQEKGVINVEERKKGIQTISAVNFGHPLFKEVVIKAKRKADVTNVDQKCSKSADFKEMFLLTPPVLPLVHQFKSTAKKGDMIASNELRTLAMEYVKKCNLVQNFENKNAPKVILDDLLASCLGKNKEEPLAWPKFFEFLFARLQPCYEFKFSDGEAGVKKGKPPCIIISLAKRASNKKVILINNVAALGVEPISFAKQLQIQMAASATLNEDTPHTVSQGPQVQVQGNKIDLVVKLLCEKYNVPKNMIKIV